MEAYIIIATLIGPIVAVGITILNDRLGNIRKEKIAIFKTLMSSRGNNHNVPFVDAINIIDVVFSKNEKVILLKNDFVFHRYNDPLKDMNLWIKRDSDNYNALLREIAKDIGFDTGNIGSETTILKPKWLSDWNAGLQYQSILMERLVGQQSASNDGNKTAGQHLDKG